MPLRVQDADGFAANFRDVAFFEEHEPAGHRQQCSDVGGDEIFIDAEPDDDGAALAREHDAFGIRLGHHRQCVGSMQFRDGLAHRLEEIGRAGQMMVNAVGDDLGVGLRTEAVAKVDQTRPQRSRDFR